MLKFVCKDLDQNCDYHAIGENRVDVMQAAMKHAVTDHAEVTINFSLEQSCQYLQALETAVRADG